MTTSGVTSDGNALYLVKLDPDTWDSPQGQAPAGSHSYPHGQSGTPVSGLIIFAFVL